MGGFTSRTFGISEKEYVKYKEWYEEHKRTGCEIATGYTGAIGGGLCIIFCPTSLGDSITVRCGCGAEIDITDYEDW